MPHVVVPDIGPPGMDGIELLPKLFSVNRHFDRNGSADLDRRALAWPSGPAPLKIFISGGKK